MLNELEKKIKSAEAENPISRSLQSEKLVKVEIKWKSTVQRNSQSIYLVAVWQIADLT